MRNRHNSAYLLSLKLSLGMASPGSDSSEATEDMSSVGRLEIYVYEHTARNGPQLDR